MRQKGEDECCELGVKDPCITCEFCAFCHGKWRHGISQNIDSEVVSENATLTA